MTPFNVAVSSSVQIAALAAPVVAAIGVAWLTSVNQRRLARDDRLADRQADAYVSISNFAVRMRQYGLVAHPDLDPDDPLLAPELPDDERYRMFALVEAYGSEPVRAAFDQLLTRVVEAKTWVGELGQAKRMPPPFSPDDIEYRSAALQNAKDAKTALLRECSDLLTLINEELRASRPK